MAVELITKEDLLKFKQEFFQELKQLLQGRNPEQKTVVKFYEMRDMLGISRGTLQNLRSNGTLTATKIGWLMFYCYDNIARLMQGQKKGTKNNLSHYLSFFIQHHHKLYGGRSHTKKQNNNCKAKISAEERHNEND